MGPTEATVPAIFAFSGSPSLPVRSDGHRNRQTNPWPEHRGGFYQKSPYNGVRALYPEHLPDCEPREII